MRNLHGIILGQIEGWAWFTMQGGNGRAIDHGIAHLFHVDRGEPPPIGLDAWHRMHWLPWSIHPTNVRTALCGRVKSKSRWPWFYPAYVMTEGRFGHRDAGCTDCINAANILGTTPFDINTQQANDPWTIFRNANYQGWGGDNNWVHTPDPISGK